MASQELAPDPAAMHHALHAKLLSYRLSDVLQHTARKDGVLTLEHNASISDALRVGPSVTHTVFPLNARFFSDLGALKAILRPSRPSLDTLIISLGMACHVCGRGQIHVYKISIILKMTCTYVCRSNTACQALSL